MIYYFHGHSDRYTVENYDNGIDTIPKMADWVAKHDAIVVCVDGYVASDYTGFYGGSPWDLRSKAEITISAPTIWNWSTTSTRLTARSPTAAIAPHPA